MISARAQRWLRQLHQFSLRGSVVTLLFFALGTHSAAAALLVDFAATPLFVNANVQPGDSVARTVTITNTAAETEAILVSAENTFDAGLAPAMELVISDGTTEYFAGSFRDFFARTPVALGSIAAGATRVYTFGASLPSVVGNPYQNTQLGFDLVIGWSDGSVTDTPTRSSGGGGGGSDLSLFNETVVSVDAAAGTAVITWNTNRSATSYLVCGDTATGSFTLTTSAPLFGYQFVVPENTARTVSHRVVVDDLDPGRYECRPASREVVDDAFTVGDALSITLPERLVAGEATTTSPADWAAIAQTVADAFAPRTGSVLGVGIGGKGTVGGPTYEEWRAEMEAERERRLLTASSSAADTRSTTSNLTSTADTATASDDPPPVGESRPWLWLLLALLAGLGTVFGVRAWRT